MTTKSTVGQRLTVAIPLHQSKDWVDNISRNLAVVPPGTTVLISDLTSQDDALVDLAKRHRSNHAIRAFTGTGPPGWRHHYNMLLDTATTELFAWLPHDDQICAGYYEELVDALDDFPSASLAFGRILAVGDLPGAPMLFPDPPGPLGHEIPEYEALTLAYQWNLGIPFRGVFRRAWARPIPPTPGDRFADQIWVFGLSLSGRLVMVPDAAYIKRYDRGTAHSSWEPLTASQYAAALQREIEAGSRVRELASDLSTRLHAAFQRTDLAATQARLATTETDLAATQARLTATEAELNATHAALTATQTDVAAMEAELICSQAQHDDLLKSRSWRMTRPLRALSTACRRLTRGWPIFRLILRALQLTE